VRSAQVDCRCQRVRHVDHVRHGACRWLWTPEQRSCAWRGANMRSRPYRSLRCAKGRGRRYVRDSSRPGTRGICCTASVFTASSIYTTLCAAWRERPR